MNFTVNRIVGGVEAPPIAEAMTWVSDSGHNRGLINLCQAVPSYPPADELAREVGRLALDPKTGLIPIFSAIPRWENGARGAHGQDYGGRISPSNAAITAGCNQASARRSWWWLRPATTSSCGSVLLQPFTCG